MPWDCLINQFPFLVTNIVRFVLTCSTNWDPWNTDCFSGPWKVTPNQGIDLIIVIWELSCWTRYCNILKKNYHDISRRLQDIQTISPGREETMSFDTTHTMLSITIITVRWNTKWHESHPWHHIINIIFIVIDPETWNTDISHNPWNNLRCWDKLTSSNMIDWFTWDCCSDTVKPDWLRYWAMEDGQVLESGWDQVMVTGITVSSRLVMIIEHWDWLRPRTLSSSSSW